MKKRAFAFAALCAASAEFAAGGELGTVKVAWFDKVISPEVGVEICGYEPSWQLFTASFGLQLITATENAMFALLERLYPEDSAPGDPYPDNLLHRLVNIPDGKKPGAY